MTIMFCPHCRTAVENVSPCTACGKELSVANAAATVRYVPGDAYVDPLIKRGEDLERIRTKAPLTDAQIDELASIKAYARARLAHLSQFPLANSSQEESAQYLAQQEARSAREREEAVLTVLKAAGRVLGQLGYALLKAELTKALNSPEIPPTLLPVLRAVEAAGLGAVDVGLRDVTG